MEVTRLSDVDLLRDLDGIVDFGAEVANGALDLGVPEQELHCTQVAVAAIDQHRRRRTRRLRRCAISAVTGTGALGAITA